MIEMKPEEYCITPSEVRALRKQKPRMAWRQGLNPFDRNALKTPIRQEPRCFWERWEEPKESEPRGISNCVPFVWGYTVTLT